jgi:hypothetical protein
MGQKNGPVWQVGWFGPFFIFLLKSRKLKYIFGGTKLIIKRQIRYRWIRHEKYFIMRPNLEQKYFFIKSKCDIHVYVVMLPF